ncbi:MAG: hypothetical protein SF172_16735 [Burkholderiales bacterium]|nr:hypothetical protein [Burkholderiales bacterium]
MHRAGFILFSVLLSISAASAAQSLGGTAGAIGAVPAGNPAAAKAAGTPPEPAQLTALSTTDFTDAWWTASESGWGLSIIHQENVMALVFYVYNQQGGATWYLSPATFNSATGNYQGPLFASTGPYFGAGTFNPNGVNQVSVGAATFTPSSIYAGTLSYTVNNVSVTKSVTRTSFNTIAYSGDFVAGLAGTLSGNCGGTGSFEGTAFLGINQTASSIQLTLQGSGGSCVMSGPFQQNGRLGRMASGTINCTGGQPGTATIDEIDVNRSGVTLRYTSIIGGCTETARIGAVRR